MVTTSTVGSSSGQMIWRKICHCEAPSTRAASTGSRGIAAKPSSSSTMVMPTPCQTNVKMIEGVTASGT
jgi:hypothetical protein